MKKLKLFETVGKEVNKHLPEILTIVSIGGVIATGVLSYEAGRELKRIQDEEEEKTVKNVAKTVVPPVVSGIGTVGCIVGLNYVHVRKYAALASMYGISQVDLKTYKEKVEEIFGKDEKKKVDEVVKKEKEGPVYLDKYHEQVFLDRVTGRYFSSTVFKIQDAVNKTNCLIAQEGRANLNEFYSFLDLEEVELGNLIQWHQGDVYDVLEIRFDTDMTKNMEPIMTIEYNIQDHYSW